MALGAIAFDNASQSGPQTVATFSWDHTVNSNANGIVAIGVDIRGDATGGASTVSATYAGAPVTPIRSDTTGVAFGATTWLGYVLAPPAGNSVIQVTVNGSFTELIGMAISLTGVAQSGQPDGNVGNNCAGCLSMAVGVTTTPFNNDWVVDVVRLGSSPVSVTALGTKPTQQERVSGTTPNMELWAAAEGPVPKASSYPDAWAWANNSQGAMSVASFSPAVGGATDAGAPDAGAPDGGDGGADAGAGFAEDSGVAGDAGPAGGPRHLTVSCGCGADPAGSASTPLGLLLSLSRAWTSRSSRSRRACPSSSARPRSRSSWRRSSGGR